jgi:trans-2-enoyl-CoA reductase
MLHAEAIAAMRRIQAFLLLPESEQQPQAAEPQAVIVSGSCTGYGLAATVPETCSCQIGLSF